jgi:hypothetical protein
MRMACENRALARAVDIRVGLAEVVTVVTILTWSESGNALAPRRRRPAQAEISHDLAGAVL